MIRSNWGFTLLEMLIGLTLLGFVLALLFAGFRLASNSWDAVTARSEASSSQQLSRHLVRQLLSEMQPIRVNSGTTNKLAFVGEDLRLIGVSPFTGPTGANGLAVFELLLGPSDNEHAARDKTQSLYLKISPLRYSDPAFSAGVEQAEIRPLISGFSEGEFAYFGQNETGTEPTWTDTWTNPDQMPQLIRIHFKSEVLDTPELVVAPRLSTITCRWDAGQKRCS